MASCEIRVLGFLCIKTLSLFVRVQHVFTNLPVKTPNAFYSTCFAVFLIRSNMQPCPQVILNLPIRNDCLNPPLLPAIPKTNPLETTSFLIAAVFNFAQQVLTLTTTLTTTLYTPTSQNWSRSVSRFHEEDCSN